MKSAATLSALATAWGICMLSSCVYIPFDQLIPDTRTSVPQQQATPAAATPAPAIGVTPAAAAAKPAPTAPAAVAPKPTATVQAATTTAKKPATAPTTTPKTTTAITPTAKTTTPAKPKASTPAPAKVSISAPAGQPDKKPDLSSITNENGYIPYAVRVPGDPTRVYNPLAPQKTIRILDKNGNPYPKDTQLKVKGTNFKFKIP